MKSELKALTKLIRHDILQMTTAAGTGHPTSSLSAVELMTALWFDGHFTYDEKDPKYIFNDRMVLSKGHAAPLLYAMYRAAGWVEYDELLTLRKFDSRFEGHPTTDLPWVDVATGSLGQGLSVGLGMALGIKLQLSKSEALNSKLETNSNDKNSNLENSIIVSDLDIRASSFRTPMVYVLMGDSEFAEGQVYEAMQVASHYKLNNLIGILDVNRLGQRGETMLGWDIETYQKRVEAFGWKTIMIEHGNNIDEVQQALTNLESDKPTMIIAKTKKGAGISAVEDKDGWHGKALPKDVMETALKELGDIDLNVRGEVNKPEKIDVTSPTPSGHPLPASPAGGPEGGTHTDLPYEGDRHVGRVSTPLSGGRDVPTFVKPTATREAYGAALKLIATDERVVVLDAETSNSTFAEAMKEVAPDRFFEMFIAEQNMVSVALGMSKIGLIPFASSFAAFLARAYDQIRMSQYANPNMTIVGSHAGVSIGEDGASQMALEDLAMMRALLHAVVLYPSDPVSTVKLVNELRTHEGLSYLRLTRAKTESLYQSDEQFPIGGSKVLVEHEDDIAVVIAAGITVHEALKAQKELKKNGTNIAVIDAYSIKPLDGNTIKKYAQRTGHVVVVEDHYPDGGLGDAVRHALTNVIPDSDRESSNIIKLTHLAVNKIPRSGKPEELLRFEEIDATAIVSKLS
ncbi:MAG: transketolase [bacterium]|nr:transketolase [bacterium]